jgi:hypothetical protein
LASRVSVWLAGRLAGGLRGIVLFSETARVAEKADLEDSMFDLVYGSNLEHAFQIAGDLCEEVNANRIIVIAYSAPSAHRLRNGEVVFAFPPTAESFAAAERSADWCRQAGLAIDAIVLDEPIDESDQVPIWARSHFHEIPAVLGAITGRPVIAVSLSQPIDTIRRALPTI